MERTLLEAKVERMIQSLLERDTSDEAVDACCYLAVAAEDEGCVDMARRTYERLLEIESEKGQTARAHNMRMCVAAVLHK